jgi:hypothetical protein
MSVALSLSTLDCVAVYSVLHNVYYMFDDLLLSFILLPSLLSFCTLPLCVGVLCLTVCQRERAKTADGPSIPRFASVFL